MITSLRIIRRARAKGKVIANISIIIVGLNVLYGAPPL
jgi:hypothetical protein